MDWPSTTTRQTHTKDPKFFYQSFCGHHPYPYLQYPCFWWYWVHYKKSFIFRVFACKCHADLKNHKLRQKCTFLVKNIINTWSYTTINMIIPFDSLFHFDWVTWCCYHQKMGQKCPKMAFFHAKHPKSTFLVNFFLKITFLKSHSQNTYESTLNMWFWKN